MFWDVDAPATLAELRGASDHPLHRALGDIDLVLTYGGGDPVVAGSTLYISCKDQRLYALNPQTGESKWQLELKKGYPTPTIANGIVYFLGPDGLLQAMQ